MYPILVNLALKFHSDLSSSIMNLKQLLGILAIVFVIASCSQKDNDINEMSSLNELNYSSELQLSALNEAIEADPDNHYLYFKRAEYFFGINNFRIAQNDIAKALRIEESTPSYWLLSAQINNELKNVDLSLSEAQKALELGDNTPLLYSLLANCLLEKNDTITANQYILKLQSIAPQMAELDYLEGRIFLLKKDTITSYSKYKSCIKKNPQYIDAYIELMILYYNKHMYDSIMPLLIKAKRMRPNNPELFLYEGKFYESINKSQVAFAAYNEGLLCDPQAMILYIPLSDYYAKQNNNKEAMNYMQKWLDKNPMDAAALIKMGEYALKQNDKPAAVTYYKNSLLIDTSHVYLKKEIERIGKLIEIESDTSR